MRRVLIAILLLAGVVVHAQTPTAEQMAIFQNLPPDQQRAILEQMQRGSTSTGTQSTTTPLEFPQSVLPRDVRTPTVLPFDGIPRIAAGDSIVIEIQVRKYPRTLTPEQPTAPTPVAKPEVGQPTPVPGAIPPPPAPPTYPPTSLEAPEPIERTAEEVAKLETYVARVRRGNPYHLDAQGRLQLPTCHLSLWPA